MTGWTLLGAVPPRALSGARKRVHRGAQWLARLARSYLPPAPDDSHTALSWSDAPVSALAEGEPGAAPHLALSANLPVSIEIVAPALTARYAPGLNQIWLGNPARPNNAILLDGRSDAELEAIFRGALQSLGAEAARFRMELPYTDEIPADQGPRPESETAELLRYYSNFARVLAALPARGVKVSPVRIWPHHFDMARLISLDEKGERTIGVGLAPDDAAYDQPYLYIGPWPVAAFADLPPAPPGLLWRSEGFTALVATAEEIMLGPDAEVRIAAALEAGVEMCARRLRH